MVYSNPDLVTQTFHNLQKFHVIETNKKDRKDVPNDFILFVYDKDGFEYIGIESRSWALLKRRVICFLSLGILEKWAFSDIDIVKIYAVAECLFLSKNNQVTLSLEIENALTTVHQLMRQGVLDNTLKGKVGKKYRNKNKVIFDEIKRLNKLLLEQLAKNQSTAGNNSTMIISDQIKTNWLSLAERIKLCFEKRVIKSWDKEFPVTFSPNAYNDSSLTEALFSGYKWLYSVYSNRKKSHTEEKEVMESYLNNIKEKANEIIALATSVDSETGTFYKNGLKICNYYFF